MSTDEEATTETERISRGTYDILRERLDEHARGLRERAETLNKERLEIFGGTEMAVVGNERIRTENNCIPRDIISVGRYLLFGYNVFIGLRKETRVEDVLSLHTFEATDDGFEFKPVPADEPGNFLADERFVREFQELYRFYKDTKLLQLRRVEGKALAVFQTGAQASDLKVFRWSVDPDGTARYIDNRGERDHVFPPSHDFEWTATTRENFVLGRHPHVSILDEVFVETVGGDLTIKVEDNTEDGQGIYDEPVDDPDQSLDDGDIHYAKLGSLILLKIKPYREETYRYFVFNSRNQKVDRIDAIGQACVQLPEDHGLIFPGGYYLESGETKSFEGDVHAMELMRQIRSPNGEDVLYAFHERTEGRSILLSYNMIRKEVQNPIHCHGYSRFDDGRMVIFRGTPGDEPTRVHPMQIWQTPYMSDEHAAAAPTTGSFLEKVGNADLVRGISDSLSLARMVEEQAPSSRVYEDLIAAAERAIDAYYWLGEEKVGDLLEPVHEIRQTADLIVGEFQKVQTIKRQAKEAVKSAEARLEELFNTIRTSEMRSVDQFVGALADLRQERGKLAGLKEMREVDGERIDELEEEIAEQFDALSKRAVDFLKGEEALAPYREKIDELTAKAEKIKKTTEAKPIAEKLDEIGDGLELLTDILGTLEIDDPTVRTQILESISEVLSTLNRARALLTGRRKEIAAKEGRAEFGAQFALFNQSVSGALAMADTPEKCDEQLSKLLLQLEELEGRFGEFDDFLEQLQTKREEVYEAFSSKKQSLVDARQRRAQRLTQAAGRILDGVKRRASGFKSSDELNTYFVSDAMVAKVRDISKELRELGDSVRADELDSRLKSSKEDAARSLRDRQEIFEDGANVIRLGKQRFSVNTQSFDLTMVPWRSGMAYHLSGTDFHEAIADEGFETTKDSWEQLVVSETKSVYRAEYLAASMLFDAEEGRGELALAELEAAAGEAGRLLEHVRAYASERYEEGYERGLHDHDAALLLDKLLELYGSADLLRFAPRPRAFATLFWAFYPEAMSRTVWERRAHSLGRLRTAFAHSQAIGELARELGEAIRAFGADLGVEIHPNEAVLAGSYLFEELARRPIRFQTSAEAATLKERFEKHLENANARHELVEDLKELQDNLPERYHLAHAWIRAFLDEDEDATTAADLRRLAPALEEAVVLLLTDRKLERLPSDAQSSVTVEGLLGQHPRIDGRQMELRLDEFLARLNAYRHDRVPGFRRYQKLRHELLENERRRLRLDEYMPKVMSAFVRNKLINDVYLPLIGDNLAKQMGSLGEGKRTDQMGLLLLISPPGYGKTTLMEYVANRLGLVFVKINGPSLGHGVTSIDPAEAPNATSRQEVEKINFALEMSNNVLLYLDDIQHTHPELLQKFISLCDAQRRIEGVWNGRTQTYDLRGKRFAICMAGNPYTESGEKFQIPDMLANRADTYNLGDILEGRDQVFALSFLENSLTSSSTLAPLTTRDPADIHLLIRMARGEDVQADQLKHPYSQVELEDILSVLRKLIHVQQVLLAVNQQYIASAAQDDAFRTEPRFQLQGSYRNMNKLAEKIVPVMNDAELESLIDDHYAGEAQTLTTGAEHNLLKLAELRGRLTEDEAARWEEIKRGYRRRQSMGGSEDDPAVRVIGQLALLSDRLEDIGTTIGQAARTNGDVGDRENLGKTLAPVFEKLQANLAALHRTPVTSKENTGALTEQLTAGLDRLAERLTAVGETVATRLATAPAAAPPEAPSATAPTADLSPYLDKLTTAMSTLAESPRGTTVVQSLDAGVLEILDRLVVQVGDQLLPMVQHIGRKIRGTELETERGLNDQLDRTLKELDALKDLVTSLRKIDTRRLAGE